MGTRAVTEAREALSDLLMGVTAPPAGEVAAPPTASVVPAQAPPDPDEGEAQPPAAPPAGGEPVVVPDAAQPPAVPPAGGEPAAVPDAAQPPAAPPAGEQPPAAPPPAVVPDAAQPPATELTPEQRAAAAELTKQKRDANDAWLKKLGKYVWVGALVVAIVALVAAFSDNRAPNAQHRIDTATATAAASIAEARSVVADKTDVLDTEEAATVSADATEAAAAAAAITRDVGQLPSRWGGESAAVDKHALSAAAASLALQAKDLGSKASKGKPEDLNKVLGAMQGSTDALDHHRVSHFMPPWEFARPAAEGLVYAILLTVFGLLALSLLFKADGGLRHFLIGGDGRFSTAQTQAALWTVAVFFLLAHLLLRRTPGKFDQLDETYLLLLGGPYAAWVIGGAITRGKLSSQDVQRVESPETQVRDLISDDDGRASLTDAQFFFFSLLALVGVFVAFAKDPSKLPDIPPGLALLTTAGSLVYLGKKSVDNNAPSIFSISRVDSGPILAGSTIRISGQNFLPPGSSGDLDALTAVTVRFKGGSLLLDQRVAPVLSARVSTAPQARGAVTNISDREITVVVPNLPAGPVDVAVVPASRVPTASFQIAVVASVLIMTVEQTPPGTLRLRGVGFAPAGDRTYTTLAIGTSTSVPYAWVSDAVITAVIPAGTPAGPTSIKVTTLAGEGTTTVTLP